VPIVTVPDVNRPPSPPPARIPRPPEVVKQARPQGDNDDRVNAFSEPMPDPRQMQAMMPGRMNGANAFSPPEPDYGAMPGGYAPQPANMPPAIDQVRGTPTVTPATYAAPGSGLPMAGLASASASVNSANALPLLALLRNSIYPSEREWAADCLATVDGRSNPQVVQSLLAAAREDPAATVRASCIRNLARMNVPPQMVLTALQSLKADPHPLVQQAIDQAVARLGAAR
jgi:hypothetical protein